MKTNIIITGDKLYSSAIKEAFQQDKLREIYEVEIIEDKNDLIKQNKQIDLIRIDVREKIIISSYTGGDDINDNSIKLELPIKFIDIIKGIEKIKETNNFKDKIKLKDIIIDIRKQKATIGNKDIDLTEKEISIITKLYNADNKTISKQELLSSVWGYSEDIDTHTLESHIYKLRQKIENDTSNPKIIITEKNGYKLDID